MAPLRAVEGACTFRLSERFSVTVCDEVEGSAGTWGDRVDAARRRQLLECLARLHRVPATAWPVRVASEGATGRRALERSLTELERPWRGGPLAEPARRLLAEHAGTARRWLAQADELVDAPGAGAVITHGEPHPGNVIWTESGPALIDWDTVALAPPERDLWMLDDGDGNAALGAWAIATGRRPDHRRLAHYRVNWTINDVGEFIDELRSLHAVTADTKRVWEALRALLEGVPPSPYGSTPGWS